MCLFVPFVWRFLHFFGKRFLFLPPFFVLFVLWYFCFPHGRCVINLIAMCMNFCCSAFGNHRFACMPVDRNALYYKMDHPKRGLAIILNHEHFDIKTLKQRTGTNVDCKNLQCTLQDLGFEVIVYPNKTSHEIRCIVKEGKDLTLLCVFLTPLSAGRIYSVVPYYSLN